MRKKTKQQRKRLLNIFGKGTKLRKSLKKALKDKEVRKGEIKKLTKQGANLKQLQKIRRKGNKLSRFKMGGKVDLRREVRQLYDRVTKKSSAPTNAEVDALEPTGLGAGGGPGGGPGGEKPGTPTASEIDDGLKIGDLDTDGTPGSNLETLASNSNVQRFATDMSGTLAEQAAAADMTIEQFKEKMNDPAYRMRVKGIRFADRGTGGMTRSQLARRGTTGVFGRSGLRIQSLNI